MPKMISDPDDASAGKKYKPEGVGSAIRVDGKRLKDADKPIRISSTAKDYKPMFDRIKAEADSAESEAVGRASRTNAMGDTYKKGGTASSRADGIASKGKTRGTLVMCGGGRAKK